MCANLWPFGCMTLEDSVLFLGKRLFQQCAVDMYSMIESQRLSWVRQNQAKIRSGSLLGLEEVVNRGDSDASFIGSRVGFPA